MVVGGRETALALDPEEGRSNRKAAASDAAGGMVAKNKDTFGFSRVGFSES